ncbi:hypothetical protein AUJ46_05625 [Candidatus Peregrinibacteria bacterium CG1_02_54_53]|nr:MAG: hypothetical protein AUJ46_05625 [Candidatus Peregrinibacteria bacterium CG1_02_54_53]
MFAQALARLRRAPWERYSQAALLLLIAFAIFWRGGRTLDVTLLLGLVASAVVLMPGHRRYEDDRSISAIVWWLTIAFVLWTGLSYIFTTTMNYGFDQVVQTAAFALLFLWMARQPADARIRTSVLRVLVVSVLVACLVGVFVYAMGPLNRFVGIFLDIRAPWKHAWPNAWAELLLLAWPVALLLSRAQHEQGSTNLRTFWKIAKRTTPAGVMVGCLLLSFSRAAIVAFVGQGIILLFWSYRRRVSWRRIAAVVTGTLVVGLLIFGLSNHLRARAHAVQSLSERVLFLTPEGSGSLTERVSFWRQAVQLSVEHPLFGWGPGSFRFAQMPLMDDVLATSDHAHNLYLHVAAERGLPAVFILLALTLVLLLPLLKGLLPPLRCSFTGCPITCALARIQRHELTTDQVLLLTALLGVFAHNLVDFNLHYIAVALPAVLILALLEDGGAESTNKKFVHKIEYAIAIILLAAVMRESYYAVTSTLARRADAQGKTAQALTWYERSAGEWYSRDGLLSYARLQMRAGVPQAAQRTVHRYTQTINPVDARGWALQAEMASAVRNTNESRISYERALSLGRYTDLRILHGLLVLLSLESTTAMAERQKEFDVIVQHYYDAILRNAHYIALSSNVEEFLAVTEVMALAFPDDAPRYQVMAAGADRQAKSERARLSALVSQDLW